MRWRIFRKFAIIFCFITAVTVFITHRLLSQLHYLLIIAVAVLGGLLVAILITRSLFNPIKKMVSVFERLSQGDFTARYEGVTEDEFAELGDRLNYMAKQIQAQVQDLRHEKSHLMTTLSHMTDGVVTVDQENRIISINPALSSLFGIRPDEATGKVFLEIIRHSRLNDLLQMVKESQVTHIEEVSTFEPEDRTFEVQAVPLFEDSKYVGAMLVMKDITQIRRLEQVRRDFIANVSHELRTPLSSIKGFAETLLSGALEDTSNRTEFVKSIEKHADRMATLVDDLLDLTAIESGHRVPNKEQIFLSEFINELIDGFRPLAQKRKVTLVNEVQESALKIYADKAQMKQVFTNLLDNAIKFNQENGTVRVFALLKDSMVEIAVEDTGAGIPSQHLSRIFERFYRVDKARSREAGGTGLGLSIVKHIIEAHEGTVRVESEQGRGTTFIIRLPLKIA